MIIIIFRMKYMFKTYKDKNKYIRVFNTKLKRFSIMIKLKTKMVKVQISLIDFTEFILGFDHFWVVHQILKCLIICCF